MVARLPCQSAFWSNTGLRIATGRVAPEHYKKNLEDFFTRLKVAQDSGDTQRQSMFRRRKGRVTPYGALVRIHCADDIIWLWDWHIKEVHIKDEAHGQL